MKHKKTRIVIGLLTGFIALTAIGGGVAMLTGIEKFPPEWLRGTPFHDYTIPALLLAVVVGGSSLVALITVFTGREKLVIFASMAAGLIMAGYIFVEVLILKQVPPGPTKTELFYFGLGISVFAFAVYLWKTKSQI